MADFGVDCFNADDRSAELNGGSYHDIPLQVRSRVNREFEHFIYDHIERRASLALETTLRSVIVFDQIAMAKANGFRVTMLYIGIDDLQTNLNRIKVRSELGFHSAPFEILTAIHAKSFENLRTACRLAFDGTMVLILHDNSRHNERPVPICEISSGRVQILREPLPKWASQAIAEL